MEKMMKKALENLEDRKENQKTSWGRSERNSFNNKHPRKPTNSITKGTRIKHKIHNRVPRKKLQLPKKSGRKHAKQKTKKLKIWGNLEFMKKDEIFIPRKFQEKITPQDTEEQKKNQSQPLSHETKGTNRNTKRQNYPI